ncbi:hypothetical protein AB1Y20_006274 [Prymnesium parvum]|uniref:EGF-like domain-containing protein n=1 Tax=Prymnesium parvum TaxID=97485 RepID=A0AB34J4N5_PRYPA
MRGRRALLQLAALVALVLTFLTLQAPENPPSTAPTQPTRSTAAGSSSSSAASSSGERPKESVSSVATASPLPVLRECHPRCRLRGTCNQELGRCDCPPFYTGDDCSQPLFPACVDQWGFKPPVAPCGIHTQPAFPATCACVQECHSLSLDARQECVVEPRPSQSMRAALQAAKAQIGWSPMISNETWIARTRADAAASLAAGLCSNHGIFSVQLPYDFYPKSSDCVPTDRRYALEECSNQRTPRCRCFPGWAGTQCEIAMDRAPHLHKCLNDCSGRGECVHNFCKCEPTAWGADCSLSAATLRQNMSAAAAGPRPRIYVYDVPPRFTAWLSAFRKGDWTHDHWYGADVILHRQLLESRYRTRDPNEADFFFIPLQLSLGFYSHRYYFKHFTAAAHQPLRDAIRYVQTTWPFFNRNGGRDHIMVMPQDQGNRYVRASVREAEPLMMIHHWGAPRSFPLVDRDGQGDHRPGHDLTVPPFHGEMAKMNRWIAAKLNSAMGGCKDTGSVQDCDKRSLTDAVLRMQPTDNDYRWLLFFSGKMNLNWGRHYSLGVRQAVFRAHRNDSRFLIMTFDNGVLEKVPASEHVRNYATSKFCLAPAGYGFSSRQYECVLVGCVPIIIQDGVEMAHEEILPWRRFSLRLNFSDIPILPQLLSAIPPAQVARLRRGLGCVWPRMLWLSKGLYTRDVEADATITSARPFDAFETVMWTLRRRLGLSDDGDDWRASVETCIQQPGDDADFDIDALRRQVRAKGEKLSKDAAAVAEIIAEWQSSGDDKKFAMRTRFFPEGNRIPGVKWTM